MQNMIVSNKKILKLKSEIYCNFSNSQYLLISGKRDFDDVRGAKLWYLWYGDDALSLANLEIEYDRYLRGQYTASQFYKRLKHLKNGLIREFLRLRIKRFFRRNFAND